MSAELTDELYIRFRDLLLMRCGLYYPERKRGDLAHGLGMALAAGEHRTLMELYDGADPIRTPRAMTDNRQAMPAPQSIASSTLERSERLIGKRSSGLDDRQLVPQAARQRAASGQHLNERSQVLVSDQQSPEGGDRWPAIVARLAQGDMAGAEPLLSNLLRADPAHVPARMTLAELYADRGEWVRARQQCLLALDQDPLCVPGHYLLAQIHEHQAQLDAALAAYRRTIYLDRGFVLGMLGMANVWRRMGRPVDTQRCYRNALAQLGELPPATPIPSANGATASELVVLTAHLLQGLTEVGSGASPRKGNANKSHEDG
jgi:tetratricopeptide (TPR) repeat protein